jgi:predicted phosphohydrolase
MKIDWVTDIHLDFLTIRKIEDFAYKLNASSSEAVVVTGDISNGRDFVGNMKAVAKHMKKPFYFVLGNHDYYYTSFADAAKQVNDLCTKYPNFICLDNSGVVELSSNSCLVGNSGFYDAQSGTIDRSFLLHDFTTIQDLFTNQHRLKDKCKEIAEERANQAIEDLTKAANKYEHIYFATHVPPFVESSWYEGKLSEPYARPWFTNVTLGNKLLELASTYPNVKFTVLCGHTHHEAAYFPLANLAVYTARADYYFPGISHTFEICKPFYPEE